jgi:hypothetical protein
MPRKNSIKAKICKEIANDLGAHPDEVLSIVESQFEHLKMHMEEGALTSVRLPYFGKFYVKPGRISQLNYGIIQRRKLQGNSGPSDTPDSGV